MRILAVESLRFPGEGSSAQGKSGPKERPKGVSDGEQVEIPVLRYDRNVGTHVESVSREREDRCKRKRGKEKAKAFRKNRLPTQRRDAERTKVAKHKSLPSRKAAIVHNIPVP